MAPKPRIIIAQLADSGTAAAVTMAIDRVSLAAPVQEKIAGGSE